MDFIQKWLALYTEKRWCILTPHHQWNERKFNIICWTVNSMTCKLARHLVHVHCALALDSFRCWLFGSKEHSNLIVHLKENKKGWFTPNIVVAVFKSFKVKTLNETIETVRRTWIYSDDWSSIPIWTAWNSFV